MITLKLVDGDNNVVTESVNQQEVVYATKKRAYEIGDKFVIEVTGDLPYVWVQLDMTLPPALVFIKEKNWEFPIILDETLKNAYHPALFTGSQHVVTIKQATEEDVYSYRNLALNSHDQKEDSQAYPHAYANVETRNDSTFFARNAIDGMIANNGHGPYPFQSWGINQQADAEITVDFGQSVEVDQLAVVLRADYPHDSFWTSITIEFSDKTQITMETTNDLERQFIKFDKKITTSVTLKNLIKNEDDSLFPALTELEVYGKILKE